MRRAGCSLPTSGTLLSRASHPYFYRRHSVVSVTSNRRAAIRNVPNSSASTTNPFLIDTNVTFFHACAKLPLSRTYSPQTEFYSAFLRFKCYGTSRKQSAVVLANRLQVGTFSSTAVSASRALRPQSHRRNSLNSLRYTYRKGMAPKALKTIIAAPFPSLHLCNFERPLFWSAARSLATATPCDEGKQANSSLFHKRFSPAVRVRRQSGLPELQRVVVGQQPERLSH